MAFKTILAGAFAVLALAQVSGVLVLFDVLFSVVETLTCSVAAAVHPASYCVAP